MRLFIIAGSKWHERRKILTPAFHFNILNKYMEISHEQSRKLVSDVNNMGNEVTIDLLPFCSKYTLNIICGNWVFCFFFFFVFGESSKFGQKPILKPIQKPTLHTEC